MVYCTPLKDHKETNYSEPIVEQIEIRKHSLFFLLENPLILLRLSLVTFS